MNSIQSSESLTKFLKDVCGANCVEMATSPDGKNHLHLIWELDPASLLRAQNLAEEVADHWEQCSKIFTKPLKKQHEAEIARLEDKIAALQKQNDELQKYKFAIEVMR